MGVLGFQEMICLRSSLALRARSRRTEQSGFILMYVLGAVLFLSIIGLAILSMTMVSTKVSVGMLDATSRGHAIDAALEEAIARIRFVDDGSDITTFSATLAKCAEFDGGATSVYTDPASGETLFVDGCSVNPVSEVVLNSAGVPEARHVGRDIHLEVTWAGGTRTAGTATLRIVDALYGDRIGQNRPPTSERVPGHSVEVCGWQIGSMASAGGPGACNP